MPALTRLEGRLACGLRKSAAESGEVVQRMRSVEMERAESMLLTVLMFAAAATFMALAAACTRTVQSAGPAASTSASRPASHPDSAQATLSAPAANQVDIDNFSFHPQTLTVAAGAQVTWINHDDVPHTATSTQKPRIFDSGTMDTDEKFSHVFATPGTYDYFCAVHPHMTGRIVVN
jgi:plastocyanin